MKKWRCEKTPGACGYICEVCPRIDKGLCPVGDGCVAGTAPEAPEKVVKFRAAIGHPCYALECAIKNKVDYCPRCDKFPCEVHYNEFNLYSKSFLEWAKAERLKERSE